MAAGDMDGTEYFESYENLDVHYLMLRDTVRIQRYKNAILSCAQLFKDKVVMDVGAGTGILSILCAQAGAKVVYAVEPSSVANIIPSVAEENNVSGVIKVLKHRVEDVSLPDEEKVDVIISEWMGFYLLHEGMLDSVLTARDRHLKPGGKLFPEEACIWCAPCSLPQQYDFWDDIAECRMQAVGQKWRCEKSQAPQIFQVNEKDLISDACEICKLDLNSLTSKDLDCLSNTFIAAANREGKYQGLCVWFTCRFPSADNCSKDVVLSTAPTEPVTHWKQTVIMLDNGADVEVGTPIAWKLKLERSSANRRHYNLEFIELDPEKIAHPIPCNCYMTKCIVTKAFLEQESPEDVIDITDAPDDDYAEKYSDPDTDDD